MVGAATWDERVDRMRQIPPGTARTSMLGIHAEVAKLLYVPHIRAGLRLHPRGKLYELPHFQLAYNKAAVATAGFHEGRSSRPRGGHSGRAVGTATAAGHRRADQRRICRILGLVGAVTAPAVDAGQG